MRNSDVVQGSMNKTDKRIKADNFYRLPKKSLQTKRYIDTRKSVLQGTLEKKQRKGDCRIES